MLWEIQVLQLFCTRRCAKRVFCLSFFYSIKIVFFGFDIELLRSFFVKPSLDFRWIIEPKFWYKDSIIHALVGLAIHWISLPSLGRLKVEFIYFRHLWKYRCHYWFFETTLLHLFVSFDLLDRMIVFFVIWLKHSVFFKVLIVFLGHHGEHRHSGSTYGLALDHFVWRIFIVETETCCTFHYNIFRIILHYMIEIHTISQWYITIL